MGTFQWGHYGDEHGDILEASMGIFWRQALEYFGYEHGEILVTSIQAASHL